MATTTSSAATSTPASVDAAIGYARAQLGKPYRPSAAGPDAFDCSGLVMRAWQAGGVALPRTTAGMITVGTAVSRADLAPGDLVFPTVGHVQLCTGGGNIIEAPRLGENVVERPMWGFMTARRVVDGAASMLPVVGDAALVVSNPITNGLQWLADATGLSSAQASLANVALKLVFVVAGVGLAVLGLGRALAATPAGQSVIERDKKALSTASGGLA